MSSEPPLHILVFFLKPSHPKEANENRHLQGRGHFTMIAKHQVVRQCVVWLFVVVFAAAAAAQTPTGTIQGLVTDSTGAVIRGASVDMVETSTGESRKTSTDSEGRYVIPFVEPGTYQVS